MAHLEVDHGREVVELQATRLSLGKSEDNDVVLRHPTVSRMHAMLEQLPAGWCVRDLSSLNGTFVNGERVLTDRPLRDRDTLRLGDVVLGFRDQGTKAATATSAATKSPVLTPRERDVLVALCRPLLCADAFTEPASIREVAVALTITEAGVKNHLIRLYDKFGIHGDERRRVRLANEAVRRGAVSVSDLRDS